MVARKQLRWAALEECVREQQAGNRALLSFQRLSMQAVRVLTFIHIATASANETAFQTCIS